jgi:hypothetical protein
MEQILRKKAELAAKPRPGQKEGATEVKSASSKSDEEFRKIQVNTENGKKKMQKKKESNAEDGKEGKIAEKKETIKVLIQLKEELTALKLDLEGEKESRSNAERRERALRAENDELRGQVEDEVQAKDKTNKAKRALEVEVEELKDQVCLSSPPSTIPFYSSSSFNSSRNLKEKSAKKKKKKKKEK